MTGKSRFSLLIPVLILVLAFLAQLGASAYPPGVSPEDAKKFMPVSEVKRGMRGYGLTVFHGTKIERFDLEILGVMKQANTGKDLILVRIGGGPITKRDTGIIAGMSGSPCYVNGKLVGAIAYGAGFAKEPVGMITPIADMLEAWDDNLPDKPSGHSKDTTLEEPVTVDGKIIRRVKISAPGEVAENDMGDTLYMQPLMMPMMVSGLSQRGLEKLADVLEPYNIRPIAGPGGSSKDGVKAELAPGAAVGMALASGDIDMTSVGTLTYRRGNKIVAFGHPMLSIGAIDAPMTTAYVDDLISSYQTSTKLASPIKTVGRIFQDRPWSIAGAVGEMPSTIPVKITVDDESTKRKRTYNVQVINHPLLASALTTIIIGEAVYQMHPVPGYATARVDYEIKADQVGTIKRSNVFFDEVSVENAALMDVGTVLMLLSSNKFHPVDVQSVNVNVHITGKRNTATIDRIFVKESEYEPGETVDVGVVIRPYKKERITKYYKIKIPATTPDGKATLLVKGGASAGMSFLMGGSVDDEESSMSSSSPLMNVDNVKQLIEKYLERERNNELVVQLVTRSTAINVAGEKLTGLPSTIADVMKSSRNSGLKMEREEIKESYTEDMILQGAQRLMITVKRKDVNENKSKSGGSSSDSSNGGMMSGPPDMPVDYGMEEYTSDNLELISMSTDDAEVVVEEEVVDEEESNSSEDEGEDSSSENEANGSDSSSSDTETKTGVKTVVRQVKSWTQQSKADFAKGTFSGVSASSENKLELAPTLKKLAETSEQFVWALAPSKNGAYVGTGNDGEIYHVDETGELKLFFETGELEVHALVVDAQGNLYAGTSPNGKVFKITPDGKGGLVYDVDEKYIIALSIDGQGNVYAGVGDAGKIYKITPEGKGSLFSEINEQQILSLYWNGSDRLIAGTGINGVVYSIDKFGVARPIFDAEEGSVTAVAGGGEGVVYAGTSPKGAIYKILPDGKYEKLLDKTTRVMAMTTDADGNLYAVSDGTLAQISPDGTVTQLDAGKDQVQILALVFNEATKSLYAGTGNIGAIYVSKCCDAMGVYESPVHDAKMVSRWGRIKWSATVPEGTSVELQTRVGNVASPDSTWTDWSPAYTNGAGEQVLGRDARYVQYRVTLKTENPMVSPKVSNVTITYLTPNQAPTVQIKAPVGGDVWAGKASIKWTGSDPDKDTVTYDVYYSDDNGKTWNALVGGMTGDKANGSSKNEAEIKDKIKEEAMKSPDLPSGMREKVLEAVEKSPNSENKTTSNGQSSTKTTYDWETKDVPDGRYVIKVVASDRTSNALDAQTDEAISDPVTICNTPPKLVVYHTDMRINATGIAVITGSATSELVEIAGVQYRVDGGQWIAAAPRDGIFDAAYEIWFIETEPLAVGDHKVEIQAIDSAGNASSETVEVKIT